MTPVDIDKLKELVQRASLPWRREAFNEVLAGEPDYASFILSGDGESILAQQISDNNAALIVAAVNSLPALIAKAERVDALTKLVEDAYREGHLAGRCGGSHLEVDADWQNSGARNALSPKPEDAAS